MPLTVTQISQLLETKQIRVSDFSRHPIRIKKRSYNYLSHILSIAIFYSIPVIQLVFTYQRVIIIIYYLHVYKKIEQVYWRYICFYQIEIPIMLLYTSVCYIFWRNYRQTSLGQSNLKKNRPKGVHIHLLLMQLMIGAFIFKKYVVYILRYIAHEYNINWDASIGNKSEQDVEQFYEALETTIKKIKKSVDTGDNKI